MEDLNGRTVLVTGANSGVGLALTHKLLEAGAEVVALVRSDFTPDEKTNSALAAGRLRVHKADFGDFTSLKRALGQVKAAEPKLDVLFTNAGVAFPDLRKVAGHDGHLTINTVVPYIILEELGPLLEKGELKTVVATSSIALKYVRKFSLELLEQPPKHVPIMGAYGRSKLALSLWTREASAAWMARGIVLRTACPGGTKTKMTTGPEAKSFFAKYILPFTSHSAEEGASRIWDAAFDPKGTPGDFLSNRRVILPRWLDEAPRVLALVKEIYQTQYKTA